MWFRKNSFQTKSGRRRWERQREGLGNFLKSNWVRKFLLGGVVGMGLWGMVWGLSTGLKVRQIECVDQFGGCEDEIEIWLAGFEGEPWLAVWFGLENDLKEEFVQVKQTSLEMQGWGKLIVSLEVVTPEIAVTTIELQEQGRFWEVTMDGLVVREVESSFLPLVVLKQVNALPGERMDEGQIRAIQVVNKLYDLGYNLKSSEAEDRTLEVLVNGKYKVSFNLADSRPVTQLASALQLILNGATIFPDREVVDLRYEQPLIRDLSVTITPTISATESGELEEGSE